MTPEDVDVLDRTECYRGYFRIDRYRLRHRRFDGEWTGPMVREVFERGHAAAAVLYDPELDRLVLIEQFRIGPFAARAGGVVPSGLSPWLLEIVAGIIDEGETPEDVVRRESVEEAGCEIGELVPAGFMFVSPGAATETIHLFCGRIDASRAGGTHGLADEHEDIRVRAVSPDEVFRWLDEGRIVNATALVGLQWFRHHHAQLRARWLRDPAQTSP